MKKEQAVKKEKNKDRESHNYQLMTLIIFSLMISFPISISYAIAQADFSQGVIEVKEFSELANVQPADPLQVVTDEEYGSSQRDPREYGVGVACSKKGEDISAVIEFLDSDIIIALERVASLMFLITTISSAIDSIINAVYNAWACCIPNPTNEVVCIYQDSKGKAWSNYFSTVVKPLSCFITCDWCSGEDYSGTSGYSGSSSSTADDPGCMGILGGLLGSKAPLAQIPSAVTAPGGQEVQGIGQFHLSPFENIWTAMGCLCPVAILFNLRKLKTIYQSYDCCIQQTCKEGLSPEPCDKQVEEATCMYFEGSLLKSVIKVLITLLSAKVFELIEEMITDDLAKKYILYCGLAAWNLIYVPKTIESVENAWDMMDTSFREPTCADLGYDEIKDELEAIDLEFGVDSALVLNDANRDGIYDSYTQGIDSKFVKRSELPEDIQGLDAFKGVNIKQVTLYTSDGPKVYYITSKKSKGLDLSILRKPGNTADPGIYLLNDDEKGITRESAGLETDAGKVKWQEIQKGALVSFKGSTFYGDNTVRYNQETHTFEIRNGKIILTDLSGDEIEMDLSNLEGQEIIFEGEKIKIKTATKNGFILENGAEVQYGTELVGSREVMATTITIEGKQSKSYVFTDGTTARPYDGGVEVNGIFVKGGEINDAIRISTLILNAKDIGEAKPGSVQYDPNNKELSFTRKDGAEVSNSLIITAMAPKTIGHEERGTIGGLPGLISIDGDYRVKIDFDKEGDREIGSFGILDGKLQHFNIDEGKWKDIDDTVAEDIWKQNIKESLINKQKQLYSPTYASEYINKLSQNGIDLVLKFDPITEEITTTIGKGDLTLNIPTIAFKEFNIEDIKDIERIEVAGADEEMNVIRFNDGTSAIVEDGEIEFLNKDGLGTIRIKSFPIKDPSGKTDTVMGKMDYIVDFEKGKQTTISTYGSGEDKVFITTEYAKFDPKAGTTPSPEDKIIMNTADGKSVSTTRDILDKNNLPHGTDQIAGTMNAVQALGGDIEDVNFKEGIYIKGDITKDGRSFEIRQGGELFTQYEEGRIAKTVFERGDELITETHKYNPDGSIKSRNYEIKIKKETVGRQLYTYDENGDRTALVAIDYSKGETPVISITSTDGTEKEYTLKDGKYVDKDGNEVDLSKESETNRKALQDAKEKAETDTTANEKTKKDKAQKVKEANYKNNEAINWATKWIIIDQNQATINQKQRIYGLAWEALDATLGEFAYDQIDEMCKAE